MGLEDAGSWEGKKMMWHMCDIEGAPYAARMMTCCVGLDDVGIMEEEDYVVALV